MSELCHKHTWAEKWAVAECWPRINFMFYLCFASNWLLQCWWFVGSLYLSPSLAIICYFRVYCRLMPYCWHLYEELINCFSTNSSKHCKSKTQFFNSQLNLVPVFCKIPSHSTSVVRIDWLHFYSLLHLILTKSGIHSIDEKILFNFN